MQTTEFCQACDLTCCTEMLGKKSMPRVLFGQLGRQTVPEKLWCVTSLYGTAGVCGGTDRRG